MLLNRKLQGSTVRRQVLKRKWSISWKALKITHKRGLYSVVRGGEHSGKKPAEVWPEVNRVPVVSMKGRAGQDWVDRRELEWVQVPLLSWYETLCKTVRLSESQVNYWASTGSVSPNLTLGKNQWGKLVKSAYAWPACRFWVRTFVKGPRYLPFQHQ